MNCQYYDGGLVISQDGHRLLLRKHATCPKCQSMIPDDSWFCPSCKEVIAKYMDHLKLVQRGIIFSQEQAREELPEMRDKVEPTKFIYSYVPSNGRRCGCTIVTDKKLANDFKKKYREGHCLTSSTYLAPMILLVYTL
jgi:hypothetical protein